MKQFLDENMTKFVYVDWKHAADIAANFRCKRKILSLGSACNWHLNMFLGPYSECANPIDRINKRHWSEATYPHRLVRIIGNLGINCMWQFTLREILHICGYDDEKIQARLFLAQLKDP